MNQGRNHFSRVVTNPRPSLKDKKSSDRLELALARSKLDTRRPPLQDAGSVRQDGGGELFRVPQPSEIRRRTRVDSRCKASQRCFDFAQHDSSFGKSGVIATHGQGSVREVRRERGHYCSNAVADVSGHLRVSVVVDLPVASRRNVQHSPSVEL